MNADGLLALHDLLADAPDAVVRLRSLVLDLATSGKLVPQDPKDEPASALLKRIELEASRPEQRHALARKPSTEVNPATLPPLPPSWAWVPLCVPFAYDAGVKLDPRTLDPTGWLLELEDIEKDTGRLIARISAASRSSKSTKSEFRKGDILYGRLRPYLTKVLVADRDGYCTTEIVAIRPRVPLNADYCALALRRSDFVTYVTRLGQGTKMPRLRKEDALAAPFPLPPVAEQHRIVAQVNRLSAVCDQLEEARLARERTRDALTKASFSRLADPKIKDTNLATHARFVLKALPSLTTQADQISHLRAAILNLAVRGKLIKQELGDEPVSELLERVASAKAALKRETGDRRIKAAPDPRPEDFPVPLPPTWGIQSFENLFLFIDYRGRTPPKTSRGIPLITAKNVRYGFLNGEPREFVHKSTYADWMTRGLPQHGDLFFTTEAPMGNVCLNDITGPFALAQRVICLRPYGEIDTRFFLYAIMSSLVQALISERSTGLTAKGIKAAKLKPLTLPVPPIDEQHRIAAKLNDFMDLCDRLQAGLAVADDARSHLLKSVLRDALASEPGDDASIVHPAPARPTLVTR